VPTPPRTRSRVVAAIGITATTALTVSATGIPSAAAAAPTTPFISEIHYDNASTDTGEFVEVQLPPGTSSDGLSIVLYNGGNDGVYDTDALPSVTAPADASAVAVVPYPANGIQNGSPDAVALVHTRTEGTTEVLEFLSYEGTVTATSGPAEGTTSTDIGVAEAGSEPAGQSLSRAYDATADALVWTGPQTATPGAVNAPPPGGEEPPPAGDLCEATPTHQIGEVQGTGAETPLAGQQVTVTGVVVADLEGFDGFHLQDADGDGDAATSDAVFVHSPDAAVDLGDTVTVRGAVSEYFGQTQITSRTDVAVCAEGTAAGLPTAAPLVLPADDAAREPLEGMLVVPADPLTVSEVYDLTSFGELTLSQGGLLVQPTEVARPGTPEAAAVAESNTLRRIVLDDGVSAGVSTTTAPYLTPETPVRVGDQLAFTAPVVLGYGFDQWRLQPADGSAEGTFAQQNTRPEAPEEVGGDVQLGAFNVLNYFLTFGEPGRGARDQAQVDAQAGKIVPAIRGLGADVVTLMEIEDTDSTGLTPGNADTALADLVGRLNAAEGADVWAFVPLPDELYAVDRDVIRNGIIYRTDVVETVGGPVGLVDEAAFDNARAPIAQTFVRAGDTGGDAFTVVANHFKSKSPGDDPPTEGPNADTGQGAFNGDRVQQAQALATFVAELSATEPDVVLMGDFNAYTQEDPTEVLRQAGFTDLGEELDPGRYSYVFDDMSGSLDHALGTAEFTAKVTDLTHWNINAVESFAYQYYGDPELYAANPYRSSDHDPLVLGLDLTETQPEVGDPTGTATGSTVAQSGRVVVRASFTNTDDVPVSARLVTRYGTSAAQTVAPRATGTLAVNSNRAQVPAGTASVEVDKVELGQERSASFEVTYAARDARPLLVRVVARIQSWLGWLR
jgi:predicted extracellular nuclease